MSKFFAAIRSVAVAGLLTFHAQAITIHITSLGSIEFTGGDEDTFTFSSALGTHDFNISAVTGAGSTGNIFTSMGLQGDIDGVFKIGTITATGNEETAPVTLNPGSVPGTFTIWDAQNVMLTASIQWIQIKTEAAESLPGGGEVNSAGGLLNLTNILYAGTNPELAALATQGAHSGSASVTFQFDPAQSLTNLTTMPGTLSTTYMGSVTTAVPDRGMTVTLMGLGMLGVMAYARRAHHWEAKNERKV